MKVNIVGPGRKGTLDQGCGRLELRSQDTVEERKLKNLADEITNGNLTGWTQLMWAIQNGKISARKMKSLDVLVHSVAKDYEEYLTSP